MTGRRDFDSALTRLARAAADPYAPEAAAELRRALGDRSNLLVARAAEIVGEWELGDYAADLAQAFDRFMADSTATAARRDPTCAAKIALAEALLRLEWDDGDLFLRGLRHVQPEPVWGGTQDTAAALRATCALGLARANPDDALLHLAALLADPEADARLGAMRAIGHVARPGAAPLLWYKALMGDAEVGPLYECFVALLALEPERAPALVGTYLSATNPALADAAMLALGESGRPEAAPILRAAWAAADDPAQRRSLLQALGLLRDEATFDFLLGLLAGDSTRDDHDGHDAHDARDALAALAAYDDPRHRRKVERAARHL